MDQDDTVGQVGDKGLDGNVARRYLVVEPATQSTMSAAALKAGKRCIRSTIS